MKNTTIERLIAISITLVIGQACASSSQPSPETPKSSEPAPDVAAPPPGDAEGEAARSHLTAADCEAQGGTVVGDIGDGAIHRPGYKCPSGAPPLGDITPAAGEPVSVEGSVCCKDATP